MESNVLYHSCFQMATYSLRFKVNIVAVLEHLVQAENMLRSRSSGNCLRMNLPHLRLVLSWQDVLQREELDGIRSVHDVVAESHTRYMTLSRVVPIVQEYQVWVALCPLGVVYACGWGVDVPVADAGSAPTQHWARMTTLVRTLECQ